MSQSSWTARTTIIWQNNLPVFTSKYVSDYLYRSDLRKNKYIAHTILILKLVIVHTI